MLPFWVLFFLWCAKQSDLRNLCDWSFESHWPCCLWCRRSTQHWVCWTWTRATHPTQDAQQQADGSKMAKPVESKQRRWLRATSPGDQWVSGSGPTSSLSVLRTISGENGNFPCDHLTRLVFWSSLAHVTHQFYSCPGKKKIAKIRLQVFLSSTKYPTWLLWS